MKKQLLSLVLIFLNIIFICGCNGSSDEIKGDMYDEFYESAGAIADVERELVYWEDLYVILDKIALMSEEEIVAIDDDTLCWIGTTYKKLKKSGQACNNIRIPLPECMDDETLGYHGGLFATAYMQEKDGKEKYTVYCICYIPGDWGMNARVGLVIDGYLFDTETGELIREEVADLVKEVEVPGSAIDCVEIDDEGNVIN